MANMRENEMIKHSGNKITKQAGRQKLQNRRENKMTEQNIMIFYQKRTSSLFLTQMNARGIERYSKHSSPTFLRRPLNCAVFHFFCDLLPAFHDPRTMSENRVHVSCDENAENGNTGMFVTK